ncbi:MAG TPA: hypothetical protein VMS63_07175 [Gaiellaceae bacterium]|jgi:apolipoprotein N-acyltransferase|nr:hypothetical protein [Gaiellaceae bacterium]
MNAAPNAEKHRRRRLWRLAAGIALVEGVVVALSSDISRWTVAALAAAALVLYATGRSTRWQTGREILWVFAVSQTLAVVIAALAHFFSWLAYAAVALLALVVLVLLVLDRRS